MIYLNEDNIKSIGIKWNETVYAIRESIECLLTKDFSQPVKPYLRYRDLTNRIIAMPAFVGGKVNKSGIKWIASFPGNIDKGLQRANSVTIINEADTGLPVSIINTTIVSGIRTAAVTGLVLEEYIKRNPEKKNIEIGIIGFGPIGQLHLDMVMSLLKGKIKCISIYDKRKIDENLIPAEAAPYVKFEDSWEACYKNADVFITCTVSKEPYVNLEPKKGSIQMNVSLRDFKPETKSYFDKMIVDDWDEICREKTDIEMMHLTQGLQRSDTYSLAETISGNVISNSAKDETIMFNPMGMAIFDIVIGNYFYNKAKELKIGTVL